MTELEQKIKEYADQYYQGNEQISDSEYDALIIQLRKENPKSDLLPENQKVAGSDIKGISTKYKLPVTMGTLNKCNSDEELKEWWSKHPHNNIVAELKLDGNGILLEFKNDEFVKAYSRGDAIYGEDRTKQMNIILNREKIAFNRNKIVDFDGWIRGEVILRRDIFNKHFKDKGYKNPRNMVAGLLGRESFSEEDREALRACEFIAYDVFLSENADFKTFNSVVDTEQHKLTFLVVNSFQVPDYKNNPTLEDIIEWKNSIDTATANVPCDGIVIKQNSVNKEDLMKVTPDNNVAFKPNLQTAVSTIKEIKWQLKGRYLSPLAIIEPVELEGTTVVKASLANINKMNEKGVYIGAKVIVSKHGMIIPAIDSVLDPKKNAFEIPRVCPVCGKDLIINDSGFPECINESCLAKQEHQVIRALAILDVKVAGAAFVKNWVKNGNGMIDLFYKGRSEFFRAAGGINGDKIYDQIQKYVKKEKTITISQLLAMFDYPHLSTKQFEKIPRLSLERVIEGISFDELKKVDGIGNSLAEEIIKFFNQAKENIIKLSKYFKIEENINASLNNNLLTICFTGTCPNYSRKELTEKCKDKYIVVDSVTKDLNILACADPNSGSSKLQKAAKNGTKVISYEELLKTL